MFLYVLYGALNHSDAFFGASLKLAHTAHDTALGMLRAFVAPV